MNEIRIITQDWKLLKKFLISLTPGKPESSELLWQFINSVEHRTMQEGTHIIPEQAKMDRYWTTQRKERY
jgi:hypothetical protein